MYTLGISAFYHDSAAALLKNGDIVAAAQEERFTRVKHDSSYPRNAISSCLEVAGINFDEIDQVVFYDKPILKFARIVQTSVAFAPHGFEAFVNAVPLWLKDKLFQKKAIVSALKHECDRIDWKNKLRFAKHHQSHAASAFFPSPFEEAVILTLDGVGEKTTTSVSIGRGNKMEMIREIEYPHSLGLLYSAVTYYIGFKVNSGEYKVMGLAPYGQPIYKDLFLKHVIDVKEDGSFRLNQEYFNYCTGMTMTNARFASLFRQPARKRDSDEPLTQFHMDMAASVQAVTEEVVLRLTRCLAKEFSIDNLCLAGGVALNCVANGKVLRDGAFPNIWVQPAAGDAGGALGAAFTGYYQHADRFRNITPGRDSMCGSYLGREYSEAEVIVSLDSIGAHYEPLSEKEIIERTADALSEDRAVGWMQGRAEFGPRALGARSILGNPLSAATQRTLNLKVKFRESFRPFAPAVLAEELGEWFDLDKESPYMLLVADVATKRLKALDEEDKAKSGLEQLYVQRSSIPAVTHVDNSARIQTVHSETNLKLHTLISAFRDRSGCPVLVNTSFNVRGEPIVQSPEDAFRCFMGTDLDVLVIGNVFLEKEKQPKEMAEKYEHKFELD